MGTNLRYSPLRWDVRTKKLYMGQATVGFNINGAFTDGIKIDADGTTGVNITSLFTGTTGFLMAGTGTTGVSVTGACTTGIGVSGACTTAVGLTGTCTTGITISGACTTGINITGATGTGITITDTDIEGIRVTITDTAGNNEGIYINDTFTKIGAASHKALRAELTYDPAATGAACPIAAVGKLTLDGNITGNAASSNYPGMGWGLQGQVHVATGCTFDSGGFGDPGQIWAGVRGVCTDTGTSTYTKGIICNFFSDMQVTQGASQGNFKVYGVYNYLYNAAGNTGVDAMYCVDAHGSYSSGIGIGLQMTANAPMTTGISLEGAMTTGISITGACATGLLVPDDSWISWGASADVKASWTGQELLFEDTRTIDVSDGYNRTIHVGNTITMTASRYAAVGNYTTLAGTGGWDAYGCKFAMVQSVANAVTGHFGAGMFEVKNGSASTSCCTASAIFLRWDNDAASGFGSTQSFIRIEDNSSQTKVKYLLDTLTVSTNLDADAAMIRTGGNAASNIQFKQGLQVKVNGSAYYIGLIAVGDWQND